VEHIVGAKRIHAKKQAVSCKVWICSRRWRWLFYFLLSLDPGEDFSRILRDTTKVASWESPICRNRAKRRLGAHFDLRTFHDEILHCRFKTGEKASFPDL
jgi:hypothetical protein